MDEGKDSSLPSRGQVYIILTNLTLQEAPLSLGDSRTDPSGGLFFQYSEAFPNITCAPPPSCGVLSSYQLLPGNCPQESDSHTLNSSGVVSSSHEARPCGS